MARSVNRVMPLQSSPSTVLLSSELSSETLKALGDLSESSAASGDLDGLVDTATATAGFGAGEGLPPSIIDIPYLTDLRQMVYNRFHSGADHLPADLGRAHRWRSLAVLPRLLLHLQLG